MDKIELPFDLDEAANNYAVKTECAVVACKGFKAGVNYALSQINLPVWRKRNKIFGWYLNPINMTLCHDGYEISLDELKNLIHEN